MRRKSLRGKQYCEGNQKNNETKVEGIRIFWKHQTGKISSRRIFTEWIIVNAFKCN